MQKIKKIIRAVFKENWLPTTNQPITGVILWDQLRQSRRSNREVGVGVPETAYRILEWRKTKCQAKKGQKTHIEFTNGQI